MSDKKIIVGASIALVALVGVTYLLSSMDREWKGIDENIVDKIAVEAGQPPRDPFINTDQGDLLLFVFLCAGTIGGFVLGYYYRALFVERPQKAEVLAGHACDDT